MIFLSATSPACWRTETGRPGGPGSFGANGLWRTARLAAAYLRRERPGHTLQPTALINAQNAPNLCGWLVNRQGWIGPAVRISWPARRRLCGRSWWTTLANWAADSRG